MNQSRMNQANGRRPVRAKTVVIRQPPPLIPHLTLEDTLAAVGIRMPARRAGDTHSHGILWRWFAFEATWLSVGNAAASTLLFVVAMTMTAPGMALAVDLHLAGPIYAVLNDGLPYLAAGLALAALLKAAHAYLDRRAHVATRIVGYGLALALFAAAMWIAVMLGYGEILPGMFKPVLAIAGGDATARVAAANSALVSYFEPMVIGSVALLLFAKQFKSGVTRRTRLVRRRIALGGIAMAAAVVAVAAHAGWRHYQGSDTRDGMSFAVGGTQLSNTDRAFGSLFAPDVKCHVSSLYGWRDDPLTPGKSEHHQGVDIAVKEGTPVHAMTDGRVMFAEFDGGLGNFVALQADGEGAPAVVNGHMMSLAVHAGQLVHRGDVIGFAGSTGKSTGPHVHLQLCPSAHVAHGGFVCGGSTNPYENWPTLSALSRMACVDGPELF
jgi:murein DD-endopeptidase MepM/ murein hydrolase activator NlpD